MLTLAGSCSLLSEELRDLGGAFRRGLSGIAAAPNPEKFANVTDLNFDPWGGIAGSKLTMDKACKNVMAHTNCGIAQAFVMASTNPAKAIGLYDELGSIEKGKVADLVFVDDVFNVQHVMLNGEFCRI